MITTLIRIRLKQLARQSTSSAFMYGLLLVLGVLIGFACYAFYSDPQLGRLFCVAIPVMVLSFHVSRGDSAFVYHHVARPQQAIFMEYLFFTAPLSFPALLTSQWYCTIIITALLFVIAAIRYQKKDRVRMKRLSAVITPVHFELLSGFRKGLFTILFCYSAALAFCWVRILPLFFLWLITIQVMSFYSHSEPLDILRANDKSASQLLRFKLLRHSVILLVLYLPAVILNAFFIEGFWLINFAFLLLQASLLCFAICYKYSVYHPNATDNGSILFGLVAFSGIVPILLPVPAIMSVSYYFKACQNLNEYFND